MENLSKVLIIGLGSIGKTHLEKALKFYDQVTIVDINLEVSNYIESHLEKKRLLFYDNLKDLPLNIIYELCVIANYGPDHFNTFTHLVSSGNKRFLIEKPLVSKIADLIDIKRITKERSLNLICHMPWSYSGFSERVKNFAKLNNLGDLQNILVSGGAKCLVTNGIHYVGLAQMLFDEPPSEVSALVNNAKINPRGSDYLFFGGTSTWMFSNEKYLNIAFSNSSNIQLTVVLTFKNSQMYIINNEVLVTQIPNIDKIDKPTRTFHATKKIGQFSAFTDIQNEDGSDNIYRRFRVGDGWEELSHGSIATEAIFAMLISGEEEKVVKMPINDSLIEKYCTRDWMIT